METTIEQNNSSSSNPPKKLIDESTKDIVRHIIKIFCYICEIFIRSKLENNRSLYLSIDAIKQYVNLPINSYNYYIKNFINPIVESELLIQKNQSYRKFLVTDNLEDTLTANPNKIVRFLMKNNHSYQISYFRLLQIYNDRKAQIYERETEILASFITVISREPVIFKLTIERPDPIFFQSMLTSNSNSANSYTPSQGSNYTKITENLNADYNQASSGIKTSPSQQKKRIWSLTDENIPPQNLNSDDLNLQPQSPTYDRSSKRHKPFSIIEIPSFSSEELFNLSHSDPLKNI